MYVDKCMIQISSINSGNCSINTRCPGRKKIERLLRTVRLIVINIIYSPLTRQYCSIDQNIDIIKSTQPIYASKQSVHLVKIRNKI